MEGFEEVLVKLIGEATGTASGEVAFKSGARIIEAAWHHRIGWAVVRNATAKCVAILLRRRNHKVEVIEVKEVECSLWHWAVTEHDHAEFFEKMMRDIFMEWR